MLQKIKNSWHDFFNGMFVIPCKTMKHHPICVLVWYAISTGVAGIIGMAYINHTTTRNCKHFYYDEEPMIDKEFDFEEGA